MGCQLLLARGCPSAIYLSDAPASGDFLEHSIDFCYYIKLLTLSVVLLEIITAVMRSTRGEISLLLLCGCSLRSLPSFFPLLWKPHSADAPQGERGGKEVKLQARMALELGERDWFLQQIGDNFLSFLSGCECGVGGVRARSRAGAWGPLREYVDVRCGGWELHSACLFLLEFLHLKWTQPLGELKLFLIETEDRQIREQRDRSGGLLLLRFRLGPRHVPLCRD